MMRALRRIDYCIYLGGHDHFLVRILCGAQETDVLLRLGTFVVVVGKVRGVILVVVDEAVDVEVG